MYPFQPINKVDPADLDSRGARRCRRARSPGAPTSRSPSIRRAPPIEAILASIDTAVADAQGLGQVLTENNASITSVDNIGYHADLDRAGGRHDVRGRSGEPRRGRLLRHRRDGLLVDGERADPRGRATIRPRLEVTVDGVLYGTPFDVMVDVADYAITEGEWLEIVTGNAAVAPARKPGLIDPQGRRQGRRQHPAVRYRSV